MALVLHFHHPKAAAPVHAASPDAPPRFGIRTTPVVMQSVPFWKVLNLKASADAPGPSGLHLVGSGEVDFVCGRCQQLLASHLDRGALVGRALMCPRCRHWNRIPKGEPIGR